MTTPERPSVAYHVTPVANVRGIQRLGLIPRGTNLRRRGVVHVSVEPWAERIGDLWGGGPVAVFRVDLTGLPLQPGWDGPGSWAIPVRVHPRRLTRVS